MIDLEIKKRIVIKLTSLLDEQIATATKAAKSAEESKSNETKSSAGDKFETGRAMMQKEQEMNESFLQQKKTLKAKLHQIDLQKKYAAVQFGALVGTNKGKYFISIGLGKLNVENEKYFIVSPDAPIAKLMMGLQLNDSFEMNGVEQMVLSIH